jgi:hypothetical protein
VRECRQHHGEAAAKARNTYFQLSRHSFVSTMDAA